jgi:hypothetical protein
MTVSPLNLTVEGIAERVGAFLRGQVGHGARKRAKAEVCDAIRVDVRTFENWLYGKVAPPALGLMKLAAYFGAPFMNALLEPVGLVCAARGDNDGERAIEAAALLARAYELMPELERIAAGERPADPRAQRPLPFKKGSMAA